jgi:hypothetical protein
VKFEKCFGQNHNGLYCPIYRDIGRCATMQLRVKEYAWKMIEVLERIVAEHKILFTPQQNPKEPGLVIIPPEVLTESRQILGELKQER